MSTGGDVISRVVALAPTADDWRKLNRMRRPADPLIDILVPVYGGRAETFRCIFSVLTASQCTSFNLLVVNDCSPDVEIRNLLRQLATDGMLELHELESNLGFVGACNFGMALHPDRDVLLLNSDTEVHGDWLDRLRAAAYRDSRTGSVTPFSNNATICSYPRFVEDNWAPLELDDAELDRHFSRVNAGLDLDIPTGVGFCMYLRRDCLNEIGYLDYDNFGRGYGEENDLCRRAAAKGWRNIIAADVFVRHYGSASFGAERHDRIEAAVATVERLWPGYLKQVEHFVSSDPIRPLRRSIDIARIAHGKPDGCFVFVLHDWGGGTQSHVDDMVRLLADQGVPSLFCKVRQGSSRCIELVDSKVANTVNLFFDVERELSQFGAALVALHVRHMHIHHLAGFPPGTDDFLRLACSRAKISYDVTVHDYMPICPRINLVDSSGFYCGEPSLEECEACIRVNGSPFGKPSVWQWREKFGKLLNGARKVYVPDIDVAVRLKRSFEKISFEVRPHPEIMPKPARTAMGRPKVPRSRTRVALLGALGQVKGSALLESVARYSLEEKLPIEFVVVGYSDRDSALRALGVEITGKYPRAEAAENLLRVDADFVWFSSVWPETYCYTLSAALDAGVFPVAFDFGAIATRLRAIKRGCLLPFEIMLDTPALVAALLNINPSLPSFVFDGGGSEMVDGGGDFVRKYYNISLGTFTA